MQSTDTISILEVVDVTISNNLKQLQDLLFEKFPNMSDALDRMSVSLEGSNDFYYYIHFTEHCSDIFFYKSITDIFDKIEEDYQNFIKKSEATKLYKQAIK